MDTTSLAAPGVAMKRIDHAVGTAASRPRTTAAPKAGEIRRCVAYEVSPGGCWYLGEEATISALGDPECKHGGRLVLVSTTYAPDEGE